MDKVYHDPIYVVTLFLQKTVEVQSGKLSYMLKTKAETTSNSKQRKLLVKLVVNLLKIYKCMTVKY